MRVLHRIVPLPISFLHFPKAWLSAIVVFSTDGYNTRHCLDVLLFSHDRWTWRVRLAVGVMYDKKKSHPFIDYIQVLPLETITYIVASEICSIKSGPSVLGSYCNHLRYLGATFIGF